MSEKFSLKWNDYLSNWNKALNQLRKDTDFADVTLITDDKVKFSAHRILLSSCSKLFKFILKENVQANSLLYLSGINSINLGFILDYIYHGEVNIYQEQLEMFLESAQKLEIEGLLGGTEDCHGNKSEGQQLSQELRENIEHDHSQDEEKSLVRLENVVNMKRKSYFKDQKEVSLIDVRSMTSEEIDNKMRELYGRTDEGWECLVCDHTSKGLKSANIRIHVETHMDGLVFSCNLCSKEYSLRSSLAKHKSRSHK